MAGSDVVEAMRLALQAISHMDMRHTSLADDWRSETAPFPTVCQGPVSYTHLTLPTICSV